MKHIQLLIAAFLLLAFPGPVGAFTYRAEETVIVNSGETVTGTLFVTGQTIRIEGTVTGDVYCAGQEVTVSGLVGGDLICAGQNVNISGNSGDDIRVAAQKLEISKTLLKSDLLAAAQNVSIKESSLSGEVIVMAQNTEMTDNRSGPFNVRAEKLNFSGNIDGSADMAVRELIIRPATVINGSLSYAAETAMISPEAIISGTVTKGVWDRDKNESKITDTALVKESALNSLFRSIIPLFLLAVLWTAVSRGTLEKTITALASHPWRAFSLGFLVFLVLPGIIMTLVLSVIGIPLALLIGLILALAIYLSRIIVAVGIGRYLLGIIQGNRSENMRIVMAAALGIPVFYFITQAPVIGPLVHILSVIAGLGAFLAVRGPKMLKRVRK